jgi:molybdopterin-guanine dinucleotide biosynthesis protein B
VSFVFNQELGCHTVCQKMKVFGIAGFKNSGKTTLVVDLIIELKSRGLRVATIKHAHHEFDIDHPGKDSYLHREAGADEVVVVSARRWAHIAELREAEEPSLSALLAKVGDVDLVLVEGYKHGAHPKLELRRSGLDHPQLADEDPAILAIVVDDDELNGSLPVLLRSDIDAIADFVLANAAEN